MLKNTIILFVAPPKLSISIVFQFSRGDWKSQEKLENFGGTTKSIMIFSKMAYIGKRCIVAGFSSSFLICKVLGKRRKIKNRSMCSMVARLVSVNPLPHIKKPGHSWRWRISYLRNPKWYFMTISICQIHSPIFLEKKNCKVKAYNNTDDWKYFDFIQ